MSWVSLLSLALASLRNRAGTVALTGLTIALSVMLFLGVEKIRHSTKASFEATISETDLIIGARSAPVNLLLASIFRIGDPPANMSWETAEAIAARQDVAWTVPLSLGDNHRGDRVLGTIPEYFQRYKFASKQPLRFAQGAVFEGLHDVVLGSETAKVFDYQLGDTLELTHGLGVAGISDHDEHAFRVVGILAPTGTPVDRTVHVSLDAITVIHEGWQTGAAPRARSDQYEAEETHDEHDHDKAEEQAHHEEHDHVEGEEPAPDDDHDAHDDEHNHAHDPASVSALMVGLTNKASILRTKRAIDTYEGEALLAVMPGQALRQLWTMTGFAETSLRAISAFVILVGLVSALVSLLSGLNARRREMAILRSVGASPGHVGLLLVLEAFMIGFGGAVVGGVLVYGGLAVFGPLATDRLGLVFAGAGPGVLDIGVIAFVSVLAALMGLVPALMAYRRTLSDGLNMKL